MLASKVYHKMMKLPITGYSMSKYQFGSELVMLASKLYLKMMKLSRTGDPMA